MGSKKIEMDTGMQLVKTLSIRQPYASLVCRGIKKIENRSWNTNYRGKLLIHASGKPLAWPSFDYLPHEFVKGYKKYYGTSIKTMPKDYAAYIKWIEELSSFYHLEKPSLNQPDNIVELANQYGYALHSQAIIGEAVLSDVVANSKDIFATPANYHWVMSTPVIYEKPILNVMGKLSLWDYKQ